MDNYWLSLAKWLPFTYFRKHSLSLKIICNDAYNYFSIINYTCILIFVYFYMKTKIKECLKARTYSNTLTLFL